MGMTSTALAGVAGSCIMEPGPITWAKLAAWSRMMRGPSMVKVSVTARAGASRVPWASIQA